MVSLWNVDDMGEVNGLSRGPKLPEAGSICSCRCTQISRTMECFDCFWDVTSIENLADDTLGRSDP